MSAPLRKPTREQEIENQLRSIENDMKQEISELRDTATNLERDVRFKSTARSAENGRITKEKVAAHRKERDRRIREAEQAHQRAVQAAAGERKKRINEADKAFEDARAQLERELVEVNLPIRTEYDEKAAAIAAELKQEVEACNAKALEKAKPLVEELNAIIKARKEKESVKPAEATAEQATP